MRYEHQFVVEAPLQQVRAFHLKPDGLKLLTPPPVLVQNVRAPELITEGAQFEFRLWLGPLPVHWRARFHDVHANGFTDTQMTGPFAAWSHQHRYAAAAEGGTRIADRIDASLSKKPWLWLLGIGFWTGMPLLFAYRRWRTRQLLWRNVQETASGRQS